MNGTNKRLAGFVFLIICAAGGSARAGVLTASQILGQFNAVTFGNFAGAADVEGRTVVGGNLTGGATFDLNPAHQAASGFAALSVYGSVTNGGTLNIDNGGGASIAGANTAALNLNNGGTAWIGGANSGALSLSGSGGITVVGTNSGALSLPAGGSVYLGGNNAAISTGGVSSIAINGNTSNTLNLNASGTVLLNGSNNGAISLNGGSLAYTGNAGSLTLNGGATANQVASLTLTPPASTLSNFATLFQAPLTALSAQLSALTANSTATSAAGAITLNAAPNAAGVAVFDIATSFLAANSTVTINLGHAASVIIDVTVDSCVRASCVFSLPTSLNFNNPTGYAATVLWNFVNATGLTFSSEFGGTVLAPLAAVTNSDAIDGTLVAASYSGAGELHSDPFTGTLPGTSVPEPASLALIATGLIGLAIARRRPKGLTQNVVGMVR